MKTKGSYSNHAFLSASLDAIDFLSHQKRSGTTPRRNVLFLIVKRNHIPIVLQLSVHGSSVRVYINKSIPIRRMTESIDLGGRYLSLNIVLGAYYLPGSIESGMGGQTICANLPPGVPVEVLVGSVRDMRKLQAVARVENDGQSSFHIVTLEETRQDGPVMCAIFMVPCEC